MAGVSNEDVDFGESRGQREVTALFRVGLERLDVGQWYRGPLVCDTASLECITVV